MGTWRSTVGRIQTIQQRPRWQELAMPTQGSVRPKSGWHGSTTVMVSWGGTIKFRGVVYWSSFSESWAAKQQNVFSFRHVPALRQFQDAGLGDVLDHAEIIAGDLFEKGEARRRDGMFNPLGFPLGHLGLA